MDDVKILNINNISDNIQQNITDNERYNNTKKNKHKEKKMRVETKTWDINDEELSHNIQTEILNNIHSNTIIKNSENKKYISTFISNLKNKLSSYKQQDIIKKKYNSQNFISFEETLLLLVESNLLCHYCHDEIYILYKQVREMSQWSLDRIDNEIGHDSGNLVIACLKCNLKRRRINKNSFMFTRNMIITRENYPECKINEESDSSDNFLLNDSQIKIVRFDIDNKL
jgi:hypothetical protein